MWLYLVCSFIYMYLLWNIRATMWGINSIYHFHFLIQNYLPPPPFSISLLLWHYNCSGDIRDLHDPLWAKSVGQFLPSSFFKHRATFWPPLFSEASPHLTSFPLPSVLVTSMLSLLASPYWRTLRFVWILDDVQLLMILLLQVLLFWVWKRK